MFRLLFSNAWRNILRNRLRSAFTVITIASMVTLYTFLNLLVHTLSSEFSHALSRYDLLIQSKNATTPLSSRIPLHTYERIRTLDGTAAVDAVSVSRIVLNRKRLWIIGVSDFSSLATRFNILLQKGRRYRRGKNEVIIGNEAARILRKAVGDSWRPGPGPALKITGLFTSFVSTVNGGVITDIAAASAISGAKNPVSMILVSLPEGADVAETAASLQKRFPELAVLPTATIERSMSTLRDVDRLLEIMTVFILAVAGIVIMNSMLIATLERTREIGILTAVGWPNGMIVAMFLTESLLLSLGGALLGFLLTEPLLWLIRTATTLTIYLPRGLDLSLLPSTVLMAVAVALAGIAAPVYHVFTIPVSKALRHE